MYLVLGWIFLSLAAVVALLSQRYLRITSAGWLLAIVFVPYLGALFFFLLVIRKRQHKHDANTCLIPTAYTAAQHNMLGALDMPLLNHLGQLHGFKPYSQMSASELLVDGDFIPALYDVIDHARERIWLTTFILSGEVKAQLIVKLTAAHQRGVDVRLLVDRAGSGLLHFNAAAIKAYNALPFPVALYHHRRFRAFIFMEKRLHSKIVIADAVAFLGAHNLRDEVMPGHQNYVRNLSLKFAGEVVESLSELFAALWSDNKNEPLEVVAARPINGELKRVTGVPARIIYTDPLTRDHRYNQYLQALFFAARQRIYIWMPYMIPTQVMRSNLIMAHYAGVDVKVLMPKTTDSPLVDNAHQLVLNELVDAGVPCVVSTGNTTAGVCESKFDHSKILIVDDVSIIGSTNLDYRSLYRNHETNIEVADPAVTQSMVQLFEARYHAGQKVHGVNPTKRQNIQHQTTSLMAGLY